MNKTIEQAVIDNDYKWPGKSECQDCLYYSETTRSYFVASSVNSPTVSKSPSTPKLHFIGTRDQFKQVCRKFHEFVLNEDVNDVVRQYLEGETFYRHANPVRISHTSTGIHVSNDNEGGLCVAMDYASFRMELEAGNITRLKKHHWTDNLPLTCMVWGDRDGSTSFAIVRVMSVSEDKRFVDNNGLEWHNAHPVNTDTTLSEMIKVRSK